MLNWIFGTESYEQLVIYFGGTLIWYKDHLKYVKINPEGLSWVEKRELCTTQFNEKDLILAIGKVWDTYTQRDELELLIPRVVNGGCDDVKLVHIGIVKFPI